MAKKPESAKDKWPEDYVIGDRYGTRNNGEANYIRELNELCAHFNGPHVHVLHLDGTTCERFSSRHTTYSKSQTLIRGYSAGPEHISPFTPPLLEAVKSASASIKKEAVKMQTLAKSMSSTKKDFVAKGAKTGRIPAQRKPRKKAE